MSFDYNAHDSWGNLGWLGRDDYYAFWGRTLSGDLKAHLDGQVILDIGAGNGRIWEDAFKQGLRVKALHLIDPALNISADLKALDNVFTHTGNVETLGLSGNVALFKQSIHHIYSSLGADLFNIINCPKVINFSMPQQPEWPLSPALMQRYKPSVLDVRAATEQAGHSITHSFEIAYPVTMRREDWQNMIRNRFTSILHDCDDDFIAHEINWLENNHPETLSFNDTLDCLIIE